MRKGFTGWDLLKAMAAGLVFAWLVQQYLWFLFYLGLFDK